MFFPHSRFPSAEHLAVAVGVAFAIAALASALRSCASPPTLPAVPDGPDPRRAAHVSAFCREQCRAFDAVLIGVDVRTMPGGGPPEYTCACAIAEPDLD